MVDGFVSSLKCVCSQGDIHIAGYQYEDYARDVRREYQHIPMPQYKQNRITILKKFHEVENLFKSAPMHAKFEAQARENLKWEIEAIAAGGFPIDPMYIEEDMDRNKRLDMKMDTDKDGKVSIKEWEAVHGDRFYADCTVPHRVLSKHWVKVPARGGSSRKEERFEYVHTFSGKRYAAYPTEAQIADRKEFVRRSKVIEKMFIGLDLNGDKNVTVCITFCVSWWHPCLTLAWQICFEEFFDFGQIVEAHGMPTGVKFDKEYANKVYYGMDHNGNGMIDIEEFVVWSIGKFERFNNSEFNGMILEMSQKMEEVRGRRVFNDDLLDVEEEE